MPKDNAILHFIKSRAKSFKFAFDGFKHVLRTQQNAWLHLTASFVVIVLAIWLEISRMEWVAILLAIGIVWTAEFLNTALEVIVDIASPENHPLAKIGKDVGAAAVLIAAVIALLVGLLTLGAALLNKFW